MTEVPVVQRHCARAILLDPSDRVLLFWLDPERDPTGQGYWYLPGGGIGDGETPEEAVARELREEVGFEGVEIGPRLVHLTGVRFKFDGRVIQQDEWHLLVRTNGAVGRGNPDDDEASAVAAHRWWSVAELAASAQRIYPDHLARTITAMLQDGPPTVPVEIEIEPASDAR